jgi:hypothetical protein
VTVVATVVAGAAVVAGFDAAAVLAGLAAEPEVEELPHAASVSRQPAATRTDLRMVVSRGEWVESGNCLASPEIKVSAGRDTVS